MLKNGFDDPNFLRFATAFIARCEVYFSQNTQSAQYIEIKLPVRNAAHFISGMWESLQDLKTSELDELLEDNARFAVMG